MIFFPSRVTFSFPFKSCSSSFFSSSSSPAFLHLFQCLRIRLHIDLSIQSVYHRQFPVNRIVKRQFFRSDQRRDRMVLARIAVWEFTEL